MRSAFFLLFSFIIINAASAQDDAFMVYSVKGNVSLMDNKTKTKARIGNVLNIGTLVIIPADAAITLICNEKNLITINKSGTFKLEDYKGQCATNSSSVSSNYLKYVWNQMLQKPGSPEKNRKMYMNNVGAVSRGVNNVWIDPRLDTINYATGLFPLTWKSYAEAEEFDFMLFEKKEGDPIFTITTKNRFITINSILNQLKPETTYYWAAAIKGEQNNERKVLNIVNKDAFQKMLVDWTLKEPAFENEASKAFRFGFLLEQARYYAEAFENYKKAVALDPNMAAYKTTLEAFKKDYGILNQ